MATKSKLFGLVLTYKEVTLFDSVKMFYQESEYFMAFIIFTFTILVPFVKYIDLFNRVFGFFKVSNNFKKIFNALDKWSMIDVFLVALLLLNFNWNSNFINIDLKIGTTFIAISVLFRMAVSSLDEDIDKYLHNNI